MLTRYRALRIAIAAVGLAIGSATFAADTHPLDLTPPKDLPHTVKIGVGGIASPTQLGIWVAKYAGFLKPLEKQGVDVQLVPFGGGSDALLALTSGQTQYSYQFLENGIRARAQGRDVVALYDALPVPALGVTVRKAVENKIKTPADIKGHRWGFTSFGSGSHLVSLRVAKHFGIDPAYVSWTPVGGVRGYLPSMREGRVDVLTSGIEAAEQLVKEGTADMLVNLTDPKTVEEVYGYPYISIALLSSEDYVNKHPYITYEIVDALHKAIEYIKSTPAADIAKILPAEFQGPSLELAIETLAPAHDADGRIDPTVVQKMMKDMSDLKVASTKQFEASDIVDNRFIDAVHAKAAK